MLLNRFGRLTPLPAGAPVDGEPPVPADDPDAVDPELSDELDEELPALLLPELLPPEELDEEPDLPPDELDDPPLPFPLCGVA